MYGDELAKQIMRFFVICIVVAFSLGLTLPWLLPKLWYWFKLALTS